MQIIVLSSSNCIYNNHFVISFNTTPMSRVGPSHQGSCIYRLLTNNELLKSFISLLWSLINHYS